MNHRAGVNYMMAAMSLMAFSEELPERDAVQEPPVYRPPGYDPEVAARLRRERAERRAVQALKQKKVRGV